MYNQAVTLRPGHARGCGFFPMNAFSEFRKLAERLNAERVPYALVGGVALAFYTTPRFTRDIDILIAPGELPKVSDILKREGYFESSAPWTFMSTQLTLHRFLKVQDGEDMIVDVLEGGSARHAQIVDNALAARSEEGQAVRVAGKEDLIWMKQSRNSKQDQADIERLRDEEG